MVEKQWKAIEPGMWKPEKDGDFITGVLVNKQPREGDLSARYTLDVKRNGKPEMMLVWGSTVLDDRMQLVQLGQEVKITFKGKQKNKRGQDLNIYKVEVAA